MVVDAEHVDQVVTAHAASFDRAASPEQKVVAVRLALKRAGGHVSRAAVLLGVHRNTILHWRVVGRLGTSLAGHGGD
jgi:transcriptional regulator of acetoin/glycerol metabolism